MISAPRNIAAPALGAFLVGVALCCLDLKCPPAAVHTSGGALVGASSGSYLSVGFGFFVWLPGRASRAGVLRRIPAGESLSVDNLFVFVLLFRSFAIPPQFQHRCVWGRYSRHRVRGSSSSGRRAGATLPSGIIPSSGICLYSRKTSPQRGGDRSSDNAVVRWVPGSCP